MKCQNCLLERRADEFLMNNPCCYKCVLAKKMHEIEEREKRRVCLICKKELPTGRWKYCGQTCSWEADKLRRNDPHWTKRVKNVF